MKLSVAAATAPQDVPVAATLNSTDSGTPKRTSLPSMLPIAGLMPRWVSSGLPPASAA